MCGMNISWCRGYVMWMSVVFDWVQPQKSCSFCPTAKCSTSTDESVDISFMFQDTFARCRCALINHSTGYEYTQVLHCTRRACTTRVNPSSGFENAIYASNRKSHKVGKGYYRVKGLQSWFVLTVERISHRLIYNC